MLKKAIVSTVELLHPLFRASCWCCYTFGCPVRRLRGYHFAIDADVNKLISQELPWRKREAQFDSYFPPKEETTLAVLEAPTSEQASQATAALIEKLSEQKDLFRAIMEAGGGPFFQKNGLLFLPTQQVAELTKKLGEGKPVIQSLAQDPNLRGLTTALNYGLIGARMNHYSLDDLSGTLNMVADTFDEVIAGRPASFSWRAMLNGRPPDAERAPALHRDPAGPRLHRAHAGPEVDRRDPQGGEGSGYRRKLRRETAAHRAGPDRRRGIRDRAGGRLHQHHRDHLGRADHPVARVAVGADHPGGLHQPADRALDHRRARIGDGRRAQPDLGRVRRAVRRPRRRFRHPVQRPLSRGTPRGRQSA